MLVKLYSTGIILLFTLTSLSAAQIDGFWQVNNSGDLIEIQNTNSGLKAKFVDSNEWDYYERLRNNTYEDRRGNRYFLESSRKLKWESRDGRRVIRLNKTQDYRRSGNRYDDYDYNDRNRRGRNDRYNDRYNDRDYGQAYCTSSCSDNCSLHSQRRNNDRRYNNNSLSGTWVNRWKNTIAYVEYDGLAVRMKTNKSRRWTTYRRAHKRKLIFEDRWGNTIKFKNNGELKWNRSDGRRDIQFRKRY